MSSAACREVWVTGFLLVGLAGLVLLAVSVVLGDLFGGALDSALDGLGGDAFSSAVLGGFVSALGFGAALAQGAGAPGPVAVLVGAGAGVVAGWFAVWLTRLVRDGGSDGTLTTDDALGREGKVVSSIPAAGLGTVRVLVGGHSVQLNARAAQPLAPGTAVHVTAVLSPTAVEVAPIHDVLLPPDPPTTSAGPIP